MRKALLTTALALPVLASASTNLVTNGSFESGLAGWTIGGVAGQGFIPAPIFYGPAQLYPNGASGEAVPSNAAPSNSPDVVGQRAAYFLDDFASDQTLSQSITVSAAGVYQVGFSVYAPANGYGNPVDARFSGVIGSITLADYLISNGPIATWQTLAGAVDLTPGVYQIRFQFNTNGLPAKDLIIDQVYLIEGNPHVTTVPEPGTWALMFAGLTTVGFVARRGRRA